MKPILKSAETISIKIENQKKKSDMKTRKLSVLVLGFLASVFGLTSCDMDSDNYNVQRPTALVTVYPVTSESFRMQLDDQTVLFPTNMKASPFGDKKVRALVSYEYEEGANLNSNLRNVRVNWIDSIRTKQPVVSKGSDDEKLYGNDGIEIVRDWVTVLKTATSHCACAPSGAAASTSSTSWAASTRIMYTSSTFATTLRATSAACWATRSSPSTSTACGPTIPRK